MLDDVPTLSVIVVALTAVMFTAVWYAGSPLLGYVWLEPWLSCAHVNVNPLSASLTAVPTVRLWEPIVRTNRPVLGLYVAADTWWFTRGDAPTLTLKVFVVTLFTVRYCPEAGSVVRG